MSRTPTYIKSPWTSKVNSILYESPYCTPLDGILLDHRPSCIDRFVTTNTDARGDAEEAQESKPSKAYAWKRRRKRQDEEGATPEKTPGAGLSGASCRTVRQLEKACVPESRRTRTGHVRHLSGELRLLCRNVRWSESLSGTWSSRRTRTGHVRHMSGELLLLRRTVRWTEPPVRRLDQKRI